MEPQKPLIVGIDLGNTNTSLAYRLGEEKPCLLQIDDDHEKPNSLRNVLRSAVLFPFDITQSAVVGRQAVHLSSDTGWLFVNYKSALLSGKPDRSGYKGLTKGPQDALVEILKDLRRRLTEVHPNYFSAEMSEQEQENLFRLPPFVTLGVPSETLDHYKELLLEALYTSGWYNDVEQAGNYVSFLPEPIAPLLLRDPVEGKKYVVFDFGGLTLDLALAQTSSSQYKYDVLQTVRCFHEKSDVGGTLLDRLMMKAFTEDDSTWLELITNAEEAYGLSVDPTQLRQISRGDLPWKNDGSEEGEFFKFLSTDLENFRIALSDKPKARLVLNSSSTSSNSRIPIGEPFERDDYEQDILEPVLVSIESYLDEVLPSRNKNNVFLVPAGGVTLTPGIVAYLRTYYGIPNVSAPKDYSPLESIAAGCAVFTPAGLIEKSPVQISARTDTDYGVWDAGYGRWSVVVEAGTEYGKTKLPTGVPKPGEGISQTYRMTHSASLLRIKIGQRAGKDGDWKELGERDIQVSKSLSEFQVYFEIDPKKSVLEMCLVHNGERIPFAKSKIETR